MSTTLVTGASGFIGSAVVRELLALGRTVRCYIQPGSNISNLDGLDVETVYGDINDRENIEKALDGCQVLYHLAGLYRIWMKDYSDLYHVNVEGTKTVLFAAMQANLDKVIYTSSISTVGCLGNKKRADETTAFNLWDEANHYVRSKYLGEQDALRFAQAGVPLVVVNPVFPFGARDNGPTPTGRLIVDTLAGKVPGYMPGGFCVADVDDVAKGHILVEEKGKIGERYILGGHNITYKEFYDAITTLSGCKSVRIKLPARLLANVAWMMEKYADKVSQRSPQLTYQTAVYASRYLWYDTSKAQNELGLSLTPFMTALEKSVQWFQQAGYDKKKLS